MKKVMTLCMLVNNGRVLLGMKKRGLGVGRWNGFGGKVQEGEGIKEAALRELQEEAGLRVEDITKKGIVEFEFKDDTLVAEVHIFLASEIEGEPIETEEMKPEWFELDKIPFESMWPSDTHWIQYLLAGKKFKGKFFLDRPSDREYTSKILSMNIEEVNEL